MELAYEDNIFFSTERVPNADIRVLGDAAAGAASAPSSFVTYFADGLAKFIATRTKQELTNAFFRRFKSDLDNFPVLDTIFPATGLLLRRIVNASPLSCGDGGVPAHRMRPKKSPIGASTAGSESPSQYIRSTSFFRW